MKFDWKLKDILMVGIAGVLFSFLYLGMVYVGTALCTAMTPFGMGAAGYEPIYGIWFMAGMFALYVIRKPGTGVVAEMLAALLEVLMAPGCSLPASSRESERRLGLPSEVTKSMI